MLDDILHDRDMNFIPAAFTVFLLLGNTDICVRCTPFSPTVEHDVSIPKTEVNDAIRFDGTEKLLEAKEDANDYDPDCTLTITKQGQAIMDGDYVTAVRGELNQIFCSAFCTGSGISPALRFYKDEQLLSMSASERPYFVHTTYDRNAILHIDDMLPRDEGWYKCKGWLKGLGYREKSFNLVFQCPAGHLQCDVNTCLPEGSICDGLKQCEDGTDEVFCGNASTAAPNPCGEGNFSCDGGRCVSEDFWCDEYPDCADGTDEDDCYQDCSGYRCENQGPCIDVDRICDGVSDCLLGDDESDCVTCSQSEVKCGEQCIEKDLLCSGDFECLADVDYYECDNDPSCEVQCNDGRCLRGEEICDGFEDCTLNGEDERGCPGCEFPCAQAAGKAGQPQCINESLVCDGIPHCLDFADELDCGSDECDFECGNGDCITGNFVCDGVSDCDDSSDEDNCRNSPDTSTTSPTRTTTTPPPTTTTETITTTRPSEDSPDTSTTSPTTPPQPPPTTTTTETITTTRPSGDSQDTSTTSPTPTTTTTPPPPTTTTTEAITTTRPSACGVNPFLCGDGSCIQREQVCDSNPDCMQEEDELDCDRSDSCAEGQFRCADGSKCLDSDRVCDEHADCADGTDESDC